MNTTASEANSSKFTKFKILFKRPRLYFELAAIFYFLLTFLTDKKIFSYDGLNMNCLPKDESMISFMHITSKILLLIFLLVFFNFLYKGLSQKRMLISFILLCIIYGVGLIITYPGYYMNDDPIIFAYALHYLPVYWHNYLTSLFYMTGVSLFPASCGPVLLSDLIYAMVFSWIYAKAYSIYQKKICILTLLPAVMPFTLLGALMCFRPAVYSSFFVLYFAILFFVWKEERDLSIGLLFLLCILNAVLSFWRSESIVLLILGPIIMYYIFCSKKLRIPLFKNFTNVRLTKLLTLLIFFVLSAIVYIGIKIPQSQGESKYYGSDYLIISTTRPLSVIVHRDQTYKGSDLDLENINKITDLGYLHNDSLSCSAYNRYNTDHNEGRYTQTGATSADQKAYLKSAFRLIAHNPDLYLGERLQLFLVTNGFFNYNKSMVLNLKPVISSEFHLYDHDKNYGFEMLDVFKRLPLSLHNEYALFLFNYGGEAYIPMLILTAALFIYSIIRRKGFIFLVTGTLIAREAVIFLTAPASFIQYSYPMMYVTCLLFLLLITDRLCSRKNGKV